MTKKDYIAIASILNNLSKQDQLREVYIEDTINQFCIYLKQDNPSFDANKFKEACYK